LISFIVASKEKTSVMVTIVM